MAGQTRRRRSSLRKGGVYLLEGDEPFLKDEAVQELIELHIDPSTRDFNLDILRGTSLEPETLLSICHTPPMMAEWRAVVVHDAQALAANARTRGALEVLMSKPVPGLVLLLVAQLPERGRARIWDVVTRSATVLRFPRLPVEELPDWLVTRAESQGMVLDPGAARALAAAVGAELGLLVRELEKLRDYAGERPSITRDDVEALVGHIPRVNRWDWIDTVGGRKLDRARRELNTLLESGETGVGLVIGLGTHILRLGLAASGGERALAEALPPHQKWLARRIAMQARAWTSQSIDAALDDLLRADRLLKSAPLSDRQVLEEMLLRMENRARAA
jgi:DNA polymerase-3 subunit delta